MRVTFDYVELKAIAHVSVVVNCELATAPKGIVATMASGLQVAQASATRPLVAASTGTRNRISLQSDLVMGVSVSLLPAEPPESYQAQTVHSPSTTQGSSMVPAAKHALRRDQASSNVPSLEMFHYSDWYVNSIDQDASQRIASV